MAPRIGRCLVSLILLAVPTHAATLPHTSTLARIRQSKVLRCGINQETPEYSTTDDHGPRQSFDAYFCRAVAIAILGPSARVAVTAYPDDIAVMKALRTGRVDLIPTLTLDLTHSSNANLVFSPPVLYDGVGFLVPLAARVTQAEELGGKKVCFLAETEVEVALRSWFAQQNLRFVPFPFQEEGEMEAAFVTGNCTALAGDRTRLAATRLGFGPLAAQYALLPGQISQDPLAAAARANDPAFAAIVRWTLEVLLQAEASGLTQQSIATIPTDSTDPRAAVLTGRTREIGSRLGLDNTWAAQVISAVGNYGELYDRTLGTQSPLQLAREQNRLQSQGGLQQPIPLK
jgi:general L-amino acid transport system substrate-binding protein